MISVGNVSDDPNACAAINAAIASQDEATVRATAAQYAGGGVPATDQAAAPAADAAPADTTATDTTAADTAAAATADPAADAVIQ